MPVSGSATHSFAADPWFSALVRRATEVAFVTDMDGIILFVTDVDDPPLGYAPAEAIGRSSFDFVHPEDRGVARALLDHALAAAGAQPPVQMRALARDGQWHYVEVAVTNMLDDPVVNGLVVNMRDVTERRVMEAALRASEARYRGIVETSQEGIWLIDSTGRTLFANESLAGLLDRAITEITELNAFDVIDPKDHDEARRRLRSRRYVGHEVYEIPFVRRDERRWASVSASPLYEKETYVGSLLMISDVTERKHAEAELERRALYDDLTGLPNRTLLQDRLEQALRRHGGGASVAVMFIDLDDFKAVNDSYGHPAGDQLLRAVAERLREATRDGDTLARFGGDEFVMVCADVDGEIEAASVAERILNALAEPVAVPQALVNVDASIGISIAAAPATAEEMLRDADIAMFDAKGQGRGRHVMFDPHAAQTSRYHLTDVHELRDAIANGQLEVLFQPQVNMESGAICAAEALVRWRHPRRGLLEPVDFINLAEASGLIVELGRQVLMTACTTAAHWADTLAEPLPIAVNVSARQLDDEGLPDTVRDALDAASLPPKLLGLEITETAVMTNPERALRALTQLRDEGVHLAIDDFGTGYSSLSHLKRLPIDEIKIDRGFIDGLNEPGDDRSIVTAVVNMANALELRVVGEGVETQKQARALSDIGCDVAQGYLYSRPLSAGQMHRLVVRTNSMARARE